MYRYLVLYQYGIKTMANTIRRRCSSANAGISPPSQGNGPSMECLQATVDRRLFSTAHGQKPNQISNLIAHFLFFPSLKNPIYIVDRSNKMSLPEPDLPGGRDDMRERESVCVCVSERERKRERREWPLVLSERLSLSTVHFYDATPLWPPMVRDKTKANSPAWK